MRLAATVALGRLRRLGKPVFTTGDAALHLGLTLSATTRTLRRLSDAGLVLPIRSGLWSLDLQIDPLRLPEQLTTPFPAYVSLQTALQLHGPISQVPRVLYAVSLSPTRRVRTRLADYSIHRLAPTLFHTYFLVAPDFFGVGSVFPLVKTHKDVVVRALSLKKLANDLCDVVGGRTVHPIRCKVGGFTCLPKPSELEQVRARLEAAKPEIDKTVDLFASLKIPAFERETEYVAIFSKTGYPLYEGEPCSSDAGTFRDEEYLSVTNEYIVPQSTAKYTKHKRDSFMVGALARFNTNHATLHPKATKAAATLGLKAPCHNPFMISVAQVVEIVDSLENSLSLIDAILARGLQEEAREVKPRAGRGVGIVEVPRGILFHDYTYNEQGEIVSANCIIPTNQNHGNIQKDMEKFLPMILDRSQ